MTETAKEIFEKYQVRKTKKQKTVFIEYVKQLAERYGYDFKVEKGAFGARNIVIGDPEAAKVLYTAHYDTCARLPFPNFITPKNFLVYLLYNFLIVGLFFIFAFTISFLTGLAVSFLPLNESVSYTIVSFLPAAVYFVYARAFLLFVINLSQLTKLLPCINLSGQLQPGCKQFFIGFT